MELEWDAVAHDWKPVSGETTCAVIDGVAYIPGALRQLIRDRHQLATEVALLRVEARRYRERLDRADVHLKRRTAALVRLIARKGPSFESGPKDPPDTSWVEMEDSGRPPRRRGW